MSCVRLISLLRRGPVWLLACVLVIGACQAGAALSPGDYRFSLMHQAMRRTYLVHVPPHENLQAPLPVVLNFHGAGSNAETQRWYTGMDKTADRGRFIVVYPNGTGGLGTRLFTWNAGACCGLAALTQVDDVGFALALLGDLARRTAIDQTRIYATGLSNGSMMAYRLASEAPDRIAAVAGVAGALALPHMHSPMPVPVMHIHSVDDPIEPYEGGRARILPGIDTEPIFPGVENMLQEWLRHDGCPRQAGLTGPVIAAPGTEDAGQSATRMRYGPCRGGTEVVLWKLTGAGHVWPGGRRDFLPWLLGTPTGIIDGNREIWNFFSRFRRQ